MVDYGLFFLNEDGGYTQKDLIKLAGLAREQIGNSVKELYGVENPRYDIKTEKIPTENGEVKYKSLKIITTVPKVVNNNGHNLETVLKKMDDIAPLVEREKLVDDEAKSHYIVFNGICFLGGAFYNNDAEMMNYTMQEGVKLGFKETIEYNTKKPVKKVKVLSYPSTPSANA